MTIKKTWLNTLIIALITTSMLSACGGKKSKSEDASTNAAPIADITIPPQLIQPKQADVEENAEDSIDEDENN